MNHDYVLPPGDSPSDPAKREIDAVAFALVQVAEYLRWIEEHRSSFEAKRFSDPEAAESELSHLADSTFRATQYCHRLMELLLAGYHIDASRQLPSGMDAILAKLARRIAAGR